MNVIEEMMADQIPTIVADAQGLITEVNKPFLQTYHWEEGSLIGEPLTKIIPSKFHDAHNLSFSRYLHTGMATIFSQWVDLEVVCGRGTVQVAQHFIVACETDEGTFLAAQIKPAL